MHRHIPPAALFALSFLTVLFGHTKRTAHGAFRVRLGSLRLHLDADEVTLWRRGGPAIIARLTIPPRTVARALPAATATPHPWAPVARRIARPRPSFTVGVAA